MTCFSFLRFCPFAQHGLAKSVQNFGPWRLTYHNLPDHRFVDRYACASGYLISLQCDQLQLGNMYGVLSRRRGRVIDEDLVEGTQVGSYVTLTMFFWSTKCPR